MPHPVREFTCHYTDQIRKKHKTWYDGRLKYTDNNHRFQLYSQEGKNLCSKLITNSKQVAAFLDEDGFGLVEHRIFGSYYVIVLEPIEISDKNSFNCKTATADQLRETKTKIKPSRATNEKLATCVQPNTSNPVLQISDGAKKAFKSPAVVSEDKLQRQRAIKKEPSDSVRNRYMSFSPSPRAGNAGTMPQDEIRSSLNLAQTIQLNAEPSSTLDPVEYIRHTNSILRTGRLCKKNYVIRNSPIVLD